MRDLLYGAAERGGGAISRAEALRLAPRHVFDDAVDAGLFVRIFPGTYVLSGRREDRDVLRRAGLAYRRELATRRPTACRRAPALSHVDALDVWRLPVPPLGTSGVAAVPIHVAEGPGPASRASGIEVHRHRDFASQPTFEFPASGLIVVSKERAIVESWPVLAEKDRRAPLIVGIRDGHVTTEQIKSVLEALPKTAGRAEMRRVVSLVAAGSHSELEIWGHAHVFSDARLPRSAQQWPVRLPSGRKVRLDRYFVAEMVDVELDGAAFHGLPGQRERDIRRDVALSRIGILVVRFSHQRLHADPDGVVRELSDILAMRRRQLGVA
jgi:very-short-patch-repair endonuclease